MRTNGRHPAPLARASASTKRHPRIRTARLLIPAMLALAVVLVVRHFEQSAASS